MKKQVTGALFFFLSLILAIPPVFSQSTDEDHERENRKPREKSRVEVREPDAGSKYLFQSSDLKGGTYVVSSGDGFSFVGDRSSQSSQLSLSKRFDGETTENEGTYEVEEGVRHISLSLSGSVKEGKIIISVKLPDGELFKKMTIDNSADIQFSQMISTNKDETKYSGKWTYEIEAVKAVGSYRLTIQTN